MSRTHITGQLAACLRDKNGTPWFLLSEESFESNLWPRTPHWCSLSFGRYEHVMARILRGSASVEGGSLCGAFKTPSAYIRGWRRVLAQPHLMVRSVLTAAVGHYLHDIPPAAVPEISKVLVANGLPPLPSDCQTIQLDLNDDRVLPVFADITSGRIDGVYVWRFFNDVQSLLRSRVVQGVDVVQATTAALEDVEVHTLGLQYPGHGCDEHVHVLRHAGRWKVTGWSYSTVAAFIQSVVIDRETAQPGIAEALIKRFRVLLKEPIAMPGNAEIRIPLPDGNDPRCSWQLRVFKDFAKSFHQEDAKVLVTTLEGLRAAGLLKDINAFADTITFSVAGVTQPEAQLDLAET